jgi:hypothetical protein
MDERSAMLMDDEKENIDKSVEELYDTLYACSDQLYVFAAQITELERLRDENYVNAGSPTDDFKMDRPVCDPTITYRSTDHLDKIAKEQRELAKSHIDAGSAFKFKEKYQPGKQRGKQNPKTQPKRGDNKPASGKLTDKQKREQSERDKKANAERKKAAEKDKEKPTNGKSQSSQE